MKKWKVAGLLLSAAITFSACSTTSDQAQDSGTSQLPSTLDTGDTATDTSSENAEVASDSCDTEDTEIDDGSYDFTLCFAGDVSLAEDAVTTAQLDASENGIYDCISPELIEAMQTADLMCLNNEFTYSTRGTAMEGKAYTFRANPDRVSVLQELGVDLVNLANNHVYDYGNDALLDTFDTLDAAGIGYFGAGHDLTEAMSPLYVEIDGKTIAFVGASRAEKNLMTPQATDTSAGILRCYDTTLFLQEIAEADANADFVIAIVHWGTEYSYELESVQTETARDYIDAGADAIIGGHSHCLQGMEYYKDVPILYSLGNYWFNSKTLDTMLVNLHFSGNDEEDTLTVEIIPAIQTGNKTVYAEGSEQERIYTFLESISINVEIDSQGYVHEAE